MSLDDDALFLDDPLKAYLREVSRVPPLSREEEIDCIAHVRAGEKAEK